jgi:hypothetical protein
MVRALLLLTLVAAGGCDQRRCEDMTRSEDGLLLSEAEHPTGWAEPECNACHMRGAIHERECTPGIDHEAIRDRVSADPTSEVCTECHGDNGVLQ